MPTKPRAISSQDKTPILLSVSAMLPRVPTAILKVSAPIKPPKPARLPNKPDTTANSVKAPPMPTKPCVISSQDISEKLANEDCNLARDCTPSTKVLAPTKPFKPASLPRSPVTTATSPKAPPIPTKPRVISPQDSPEKLLSPFAIVFKD